MNNGLLAVSQPDLWKPDTTNPIRFRNDFTPVPRIEYGIIANRCESSDITLFIEKVLWEIIWHMDIDCAKLHLWLATYAFRQLEPWDDEIKLLGSDLVKELGWDNRKDRNSSDQLRRVAHYMWVLSNVTIKVIHDEGQKYSGTDFTRLWNVPLLREYGESNHEGKIEDLKDVAIMAWPGNWIEHFGNKEAMYKRGWACQELLKLDSQKDEIAMRLGVYSILDDRVNPRYKYQLEDLLQAILPKIYMVKAFSHSTAILNFKQKVYQAFDALLEIGWQIKGLEYKSNVEDMLASVISLKPPTPTPEKLSNTDVEEDTLDHLIKGNKPPKISLTKEQIRKFRLSKGWTQQDLGKYMGISQELVSKIERGDRGINARVEKVVRRIMETPPPNHVVST